MDGGTWVRTVACDAHGVGSPAMRMNMQKWHTTISTFTKTIFNPIKSSLSRRGHRGQNDWATFNQ